MKCMIFSGGSLDAGTASGFFHDIRPDYVIAADRGLEVCDAAGIRPDLIIGDFDSISAEMKKRYRIDEPGAGSDGSIERFPPEKDLTDTELAVGRAVSAGAGEIWLAGATGTRLDHVLANIGLLYRLMRKGIRAWIIDANNRIHAETADDGPGQCRLRRDRQYGEYVSLIPYGGPVRGLTLKGMKYPLEDKTVYPGEESLCVSNEITEETAGITWKRGTLLIIESKD